MATKLFLRDSNTSGATTGSDAMHDLLATAGVGAVNYIKASSAGPVTPPTAGTQWTKTSGGTVCTWVSRQLNAVTISGTVTFNVWALESALSANATVTAELYRLNSAGTIISTIASATLARAEITAAALANNWTPTVTSQTLSAGDRLGVRLFIDDGSGVTMASGQSATVSTDGATGALNGDTWVQVTQSLSYYNSAAPSETITLSESTNSKRKALTGQAESLSLTESTSAKRAVSTGQAESLSLSESTNTKRAASAGQTESLLFSEATGAFKSGKATSQAESLSLSESSLSLRRILLAQLETVSLAEAVASRRAAISGQAESLALTDIFAGNHASSLSHSETFSLIEAARFLADFIVSKGESLGLGEAVQSILYTSISNIDFLVLEEAFTSFNAALVNSREAVSVSDSQLDKTAAMFEVSEALSLFESSDDVQHALVVQPEDLSLAEEFDSGSLSFSASPYENTVLVESTQVIVSSPIKQAESLALSSTMSAFEIRLHIDPILDETLLLLDSVLVTYVTEYVGDSMALIANVYRWTKQVFANVLTDGTNVLGTAANPIVVSQSGAFAKVSQRILFSDLASVSTVNVGAALPTGAVVLGHEVALTTAFAGGTNSAIKLDLGGSDTVAMVNKFDVLVNTAGGKLYSPGFAHLTSHADHATGSYSAEQLVATFTPTGDTLAHLTAGDLTITVWYMVLA